MRPRRDALVGNDLGIGAVDVGSSDDVARELDRERKLVAVAQLLGHLPADEDGVRLPSEVAQHAELVLDLGPTGNEHERPLDLPQQLSEFFKLPLEQKAGIGRQQLGDADRRGVQPRWTEPNASWTNRS